MDEMSHALPEVTLHVPAQRAAWLAGVLQAEVGSTAEIRVSGVLPVLELSRLRCLYLTIAGSGEHVRCPYVPLLVGLEGYSFGRFRGAAGVLAEVDWLVLGAEEGVAAQLREVAEALRGLGGARFAVVPFLSMSGPLPQTPMPDDVQVELTRSGTNHNQLGWCKSYQNLMSLPEEDWASTGLANMRDLYQLFEPHMDRLLPGEPRLILDLGCGLGQLARTLALRFPKARVVGLDSSAEAIGVAKKAHSLPNLSLKVADFSSPLGFRPGSVDLIVSANALPYAVNQHGTATELMGMLRPGGLLLNYCRTEESHLFWDFPLSLFQPTNSQIFLADWIFAAHQHGLATEAWSIPMGMSPIYYRASCLPLFTRLLGDYTSPRQGDPAMAHRSWNSHVMLIHSAHAAAVDESRLPLANNHFARLEQVLSCAPEAPAECREALVASWFSLSKSMELFEELLDFCLAVMPGAAPALKAILAPALSRNRQSA